MPDLGDLWSRIRNAISGSGDEIGERVLSEATQKAVSSAKAVDGVRALLKGDTSAAGDILGSLAREILGSGNNLELTAKQIADQVIEMAAKEGLEVAGKDAREKVIQSITSSIGEAAIRYSVEGVGIVYRIR